MIASLVIYTYSDVVVSPKLDETRALFSTSLNMDLIFPLLGPGKPYFKVSRSHEKATNELGQLLIYS